MKIPRIIDKASRRVGSWLQAHNFRTEEVWPARKTFEKEVDDKFAAYLKVLSSLDNLRPDATKMEVGNAGEFSAYGAFMFNDIINKLILDISNYGSGANLSSVRAAYGSRLNAILSIGRKGTCSFMVEECTKEKLLDDSRWSEVLRDCPEILLLPMFANADCVHYSHKLMRGIIAIQHYDTSNFKKYDTETQEYREKLLEDILHTMCAGFHILSYNTYSKLHSRLPANFSARLPALKLKMKACSNEDYSYTAG